MAKARNYEQRNVAGVSKNIKITRDGDVYVNGQIDYSMGSVPLLTGGKMSVQMAIHRTFPDIPMRTIPTR